MVHSNPWDSLGPSPDVLSLRTPDSQLWRLTFDAATAGQQAMPSLPGSTVRVSGTTIRHGTGMPTLQVLHILPPVSSHTKAVTKAVTKPAATAPDRASGMNPGRASADTAMAGHTVPSAASVVPQCPGAALSLELPTLVLILDFCGKGGGPAASRQQVESFLFDSAAQPGDQTLQSYVDTCSAGRSMLSPTNSKVSCRCIL